MKKKKQPLKIAPGEMIDMGGMKGAKGAKVTGGTSHVGRNKHPSAESRKTTGLPHHSPGSDGHHRRMAVRGQALGGKKKKKSASK